MEALAILFWIASCAGCWVLGYYDIPNLKLSQKDAIQDYIAENPHARITSKRVEDIQDN